VRLAQQHGSLSEIPAETQMKRRIFGLENEYGLTCTLNGQHLSPDHVVRYLFEKVIPGARNA
jgi:proteasome accessory factor A